MILKKENDTKNQMNKIDMKSGTNHTHTYFYGRHHPFSQWYKCSFVEKTEGGDIIEYTNMETYMMLKKALLFGDSYHYKKIMDSGDPKTVKALGRKVKKFKESVWIENRERIVYKGNLLKFSQNPVLLEKLRNTKYAVLIEASPYDKIWGAGESEYELRYKLKNNPEYEMKGRNLLGKILMEVRNTLK